MHGQKNDKVARIVQADAITNPATVVVKAGDATIAKRAVLGTRELGKQTSAAACATGKYDLVIRVKRGEREKGASRNGTRVGEEDRKPRNEG